MSISRSAAARPAEGPDPRRASKALHVYDEIKEAILSGTLEPGLPIDKSALCERLGMSRFPVTTAINRLAYERLVVIEPQHGSFVAKIALSDVREFMLIRRALEGDIAATAAERRQPDLVEALDRNLRYQAAAAEAKDRTGCYMLDVAFHQTLCASLGLSHAGSILDGLRSHLERIRRLLTAPSGRLTATVDEHRAIVSAIAAGDAAGAQTAMRHHLEEATVMFNAFARQNPSLFSDEP